MQLHERGQLPMIISNLSYPLRTLADFETLESVLKKNFTPARSRRFIEAIYSDEDSELYLRYLGTT